MQLVVSGQTLAGISCGLKFYRTDEQGRMFNRYGKRIYSEREVWTVEESSEGEETELGVENYWKMLVMIKTLQPRDDREWKNKGRVKMSWNEPRRLREETEMVTMEVMVMEMMSKKKMMMM